jgi:ubiquinone/menaquinone biosynthesis C-methylase UbiE
MHKALKEKLDTIAQVFDVEKLAAVEADDDYIRSYYLKNKIPYSIFHTKQNFVHMGISRDGIYKQEDLLEHARFVHSYITAHSARNILELATGRGANSQWLAHQHPDKNFHGIDLSEGQISFARTLAEKIPNFSAEPGDFHDLGKFEENSFDIVFIVEALCHSRTPQKVLSEVRRVLKPEGHFIVFDGYAGQRELSPDEKLAASITGHGMAVAEFFSYDHFKSIADSVGFAVAEEEDLSPYVIPTMRRFEKLAEKFFSHPRIGRILARLLPQEFTYNAVSGMLMPLLFEEKVFEYWVTAFRNIKGSA